MSSLSHHGIKGQRWGVRRYQNKDGTRTAAGKDRDVKNNFRKKLAKAGMQTVTIDMSYAHKPSDLAKQNSNFIDKDVATNILKKGSVVNRFAGDNEPLDDKRKYVSFTPNDKEQYYNWAQNDMLGIALTDTPHLYEYELTKDIRIASGKAVSKIICDDLKDKKIADNPKYDAIQGRTYAEAIQKDMENTAIQRGVELAKIGRLMVSDKEKRHLDEIKKEADQMRAASTSTRQAYLNDGSKAHDRFMKRMNRTKYDAYVDLFDTNYNGYGAEYPLVIMNPKDKLRLKKKTNINDVTFGAQHTSIGGTMYIEGSTLILGDSSYLEHHGIRGQRWGVRRFQNRDGSLTNAGRKRLGYATKGVTQTVGKAFKAGVKAGSNAVKAVKAHHEKAEAKKKEKKKEKASKTRIGVMANKDLFTNEEIRKLNERFKLEDEMKMATLQKGVEIAKAVGTIAQNVGTMAKAYEDVTGQSLSPIKRKAAEEKAKQDAEDRKRKLAKEDAETKRAEDKEKRDIEDRERRIKLEDEDRVRKQAKEDADAQRAENAEKRAQAKEQRDSSMAVELQRKAKAAADEQEHKAVKAKAESRSSILDVLEKIDKIQDHDDDDHNNPPGGGIDTWDDDDYLNFFKKTGIIHSDISDPSIIQNGVLFVDSSDGLAHHGVKGQRWGVRRFQNEDGSLTDKGRKHYEKALAKEKRKQASSDAIRGTLERQHPFAVTGAAIMGAVAAGMSIAATGGASVAMITAGSAISAAVSAGLTHATYSASEAWEGRGTKMRSKKIAKYENMLKQSDMEEGMYHVENGTLFINAGEPYLEHHGVLGMKWGKHLRAGKGPADAPASAGGGGGEDDEKLKEMAKKAGMTVAEYRTKMAGKLSGAASKVGEKVYDAAGGSHKKNAEGWRKMAQEESNAARASERSSHENSARAASQDRKYGSGGDVYRRAADSDKENAETHRSNAKGRSERAASEQAAYEKSLAGRYDKMKADRARKKSSRQDKAFSGTSPKEKKRVARKDQYLALPEQKKRSRSYDNKAAETRRARAERLTRDSEIFNRAAEESKRKQNSALNKGNKREAEQHGKNANFAQDWAEEGRRGAKDWRTGRRTGKPVLRTDSLDQVKKQHDKTLSGKLDKARHTIQRGKQKLYNAAGGKYKEAYQKKKVQYRNDLARMERAKIKGDHWNASAAGSMFNLHSQEANRLYNKYDDSLAGRYDEFKAKRKKKKAKHFDNTNAIYTEGTRLVIYPKA